MYKVGDVYTVQNPETGQIETYEVIAVTDEPMPDGTVVTSYTSKLIS